MEIEETPVTDFLFWAGLEELCPLFAVKGFVALEDIANLNEADCDKALFLFYIYEYYIPQFVELWRCAGLAAIPLCSSPPSSLSSSSSSSSSSLLF